MGQLAWAILHVLLVKFTWQGLLKLPLLTLCATHLLAL